MSNKVCIYFDTVFSNFESPKLLSLGGYLLRVLNFMQR